MDNDLMARRLRPPSQPSRPMSVFSASTPHAPSPTPWAALPDGRPEDEAVAAEAAPEGAHAQDDNEAALLMTDSQPDFDTELRSDVPWDRPDPEPWPPTMDAEVPADGDFWSSNEAAPTVNEGSWHVPQPASEVEQPATEVEQPATEVEHPTWDQDATSTWATATPWDAAAESQNGWAHEAELQPETTGWSSDDAWVHDETNVVSETRDDAPSVVSEGSAEETAGEPAINSSDSAASNTDDAPWETFDQAVAAAEPPSVEAFSAHWEASPQDSMSETVAETDQSTDWNWHAPEQTPEETVEAVAETTVDPVEAVAPPADQAPEWDWTAATEPTEPTSEFAEPTEAVAEPTEAVAEPVDAVSEPVANSPADWETYADPTEAVAEPTEAVAEPATAEDVAESAVDTNAETSTPEAPEWRWDSATEQVTEPIEAVAEPASQTGDELVEAVAETVAPWEPTVEAVAEPVEIVSEPATVSTADWETYTEPAADHTNEWNWAAPEETVEAVAEPADEPIEAFAPVAETTEESVEAVAETDEQWEPTVEALPASPAPEWHVDASPEPAAEPVEAVAEPVTAEVTTEEPQFGMETPAIAVAAVADPETDTASEATGDDEMDAFVEGRPSWDMPEPFEFDDGDTVDDRPMEMLASYDEMMPIVTAAVAAAKTEPVAATVQASAEDSAAQDPDDAMAPVLNDVDQPQVPNWTLWQPPSDVGDGRPVHQPAFVGKVVGPTPPDDLFEDTETDDKPEEAAQPQTTAQVIGATIATGVGDAVVHQVPALYSTAPYGIQQPLVVRIELTIVDESNKLRAAEMARPVGPWSDVPVDTEDFDDEGDDQDRSAARTAPPPPNQPARSHWDNAMANAPAARQSDPGASAWAIPALDNDRPTNARAANATWAPLDHDDPLADLPAAPYGTGSQTRRASPTAQANGQTQPAWFDSAAPVRTGKPGTSLASAKSVSGVQPAASGDQSDLWFLASEPDGYVADQPATEKAQSSRLVMTGVTVVMAAVVVLLVLVFVQLMTSLLK